MSTPTPTAHVAVIGAGIAGAACAASLRRGGLKVSVFDKSRGPGGRMATRRAVWTDAEGRDHPALFDHGVPLFGAGRARFRAMLARAQQAGAALPWHPLVRATWPQAPLRDGFVATPTQPALARYLLGDTPVHTTHAVTALQRHRGAWRLLFDDGSSAGGFGQVVLALPPAQASAVLAGPHAAWSRKLAALPMHACWTLMAVTDDVDWPWDMAFPDRGPLARVLRNDRVPGREAPRGIATWVAQASPEWSAEHLEDEAEDVQAALLRALAEQLPGGVFPGLHHSAVHRWRYAMPAGAGDSVDCWWDGQRGLGVCGDFLGAGDVEAAWQSGDEMACTLAAALEGLGSEADTEVSAETA